MAASTRRARRGVCGRQLLAQTSLAPKRTLLDCVASLSLRCALPGPRVGQSAVDSNVHASQAGGNFLNQSSTPAGAPHRCRHKQSQVFCEQSGLPPVCVRGVLSTRAWPCRQRCRILDTAPHCNSTHKHAPPCCKQPRKSTVGLQTCERGHHGRVHVSRVCC